MKKVFTIQYDCDPCGEHWSITDKFFKTEKDAERYIRENLVNEKEGIACFYDQFTINELDLWKPESNQFEKRNQNFKEQEEMTTLPLIPKEKYEYLIKRGIKK